MRIQHWIASVLVALGAVSCGENGPPAAQPQAQLSQPSAASAAAGMPFSRHPAAIHAAGAAKTDGPVPPADAQWTIMCDSVEGPSHVESAALLKQRLIQLSGMRDWYVLHGEKESTLYYGYYARLDRKADQDRARIATLTDRLGNRLVRGGVLVPVSEPDPQAPPEWNLLNTQKNAYWTIEIATFLGDSKRKQAAVQAVRELREKGEQAYFYHGPTASSVCIGAWPREALQEQGTGIDKNGQMRDDAYAHDPTQPLLVFDDVAPPNLAKRIVEPGTNKPMLVMAMKRQYNDPLMEKKAGEYPYHYVNYELRGTRNGDHVLPDPSVLVVIPHEQSAGTEEDYQLTGGAERGHPPVETRGPSDATPGDDALRSIGSR